MATDKELSVYRVLALAAVFIILVLGLLRQLGDPEPIHLVMLRIVVGVVCVGYYLGLRGETIVRRYPQEGLVLVLSVITAWILSLAWFSAFAVKDCFALITMLVGCTMGCRSRKTATIYLVVTDVTVLGSLFLTPAPIVEAPVFA